MAYNRWFGIHVNHFDGFSVSEICCRQQNRRQMDTMAVTDNDDPNLNAQEHKIRIRKTEIPRHTTLADPEISKRGGPFWVLGFTYCQAKKGDLY
jgi:hypothetical protein